MTLFTSIRRTVVPFIMGLISLLPFGHLIDGPQVEAALVVLLGATYYAVFRWLEEKGLPVANFLIGMGPTPKPNYDFEDEE